MFEKFPKEEGCAGYCPHCDEVHSLGEANARQYAFELMKELETKKRLDIDVPDSKANPDFSDELLWQNHRGKMFGVLECHDTNGDTVVIKAFSGGLPNNVWNLDGWAPCLVDLDAYNELVPPVDAQIKALTAEVLELEKGSPEYCAKSFERKKICQQLMRDIHDLYSALNLSGEHRPLVDVFLSDKKGIPTGAGDCCAPKLINEAIKRNLKPIGLVEFFWGQETKSGGRQQGEFYGACKEKCHPLLGYMLCPNRNTSEAIPLAYSLMPAKELSRD